MSKRRKESIGRGSETLGEDRDKLFSELETKLLTIARSSTGETLSRRASKEMEILIDEYYERWKK